MEQSSKLGAVQTYWWPCMWSNSLRVLGKQLNCTPRARVTNERPPQPSGHSLCQAQLIIGRVWRARSNDL